MMLNNITCTYPLPLCAYFIISASTLFVVTAKGTCGRTSCTFLAAERFLGVSFGMPTMFENGCAASHAAVATLKNSGLQRTMRSGYFFCTCSVVPGSNVDLMTAIFPLPTGPTPASTILESNPLGFVGVGTQTKTISA